MILISPPLGPLSIRLQLQSNHPGLYSVETDSLSLKVDDYHNMEVKSRHMLTLSAMLQKLYCLWDLSGATKYNNSLAISDDEEWIVIPRHMSVWTIIELESVSKLSPSSSPPSLAYEAWI
jgi:hypothetical protein